MVLTSRTIFHIWLAWVNHVNGLNDRVEKVAKEFDAFLEGVVEEHVSRHNRKQNVHMGIQDEDQKDFVDTLLEIQRENTVGFPIERVCIKAVVLVRTFNIPFQSPDKRYIT